jgi:predicted N-acyltransferase
MEQCGWARRPGRDVLGATEKSKTESSSSGITASVRTSNKNLSSPTSAALTTRFDSLLIRSLASVSEIPRNIWDELLPGDPENWDQYFALEKVSPQGFELGALAAFDAEEIVAAAPLFRFVYRIDTSLHGPWQRLTNGIYTRWPRLLSFAVVGIGSPMSDNCAVGFSSRLSEKARLQAFEGLLAHLAAEARTHRSALCVIKSLNTAQVLEEPLVRYGYRRMKSLPVVMLDLPYATLDEYLDSLPRKTGSYLRRKMRSVDQVRIEYRSHLTGLEERIRRLFESTLTQSKVHYHDFEELHPDYFRRIVEEGEGSARLMLCWRGDELLSFQIFLASRSRILACHTGMKYPEARDLNLYFINWLKLIEFAIDHRIPCVEMGATTYTTKLLFGGYLDARLLYFRFRNPVWNSILSPLASFFDFERNDPELQKLMQSSDPPVRRG